MSDYTPTTEAVENAYAHDPESKYRDPVNYSASVAQYRREFRRWLAEVIREAKREGWDEGFDAGERDVFGHVIFDEPCIENPYRKEQQ